MTTSLSDLQEFLETFRALSSVSPLASPSTPPEDFFRQANRFRDLLHQERMLTAGRFNVFEALAMTDDELLHSRFLAYLLDPQARHDQGTMALRSFLGRVGLQDFLPIDLPAEEISVWTEWLIPTGRMDVAVFIGRDSIVVLENKVWTSEQVDQLGRYQRWLSGQTSRGAIVFLTPEGRTANSAAKDLSKSDVPVVQISYTDVAAWLDDLRPQVPPPLATTLRMYRDVCEKIGILAKAWSNSGLTLEGHQQ